MNADVVLLFAYVFMALFFSFLCSIAESVLLSVTPYYIEEKRESHPKISKLLKSLKQDNIDRSLAAILTLNTIAHTVGAIMAGAKATLIFGSAWFGLFSAVMTLMILLFSEIVPKTIGAIYWSKLVVPTTIFVNSLILTLYPIVWLSERLTKFISNGRDMHIFSRPEFFAMARVGGQTGHLSDNESQIIVNLFRFDQTQVREVMIPRPRIVALDIEQDRDELLKLVLGGLYSRYPVYRGEIENVIGFIHAKDLFGLATKAPDFDLMSIVRSPFFVPESKKIKDLLREMQRGHIHLALVVDEYGSLSGIVTTEDLLEELVGEIEDEHDASGSKRIEHLRDGGYIVDALLPLNDLEDLLGVPFPEGMPYDTLAGLILFQLGRFPAKGEQIPLRDYIMTCVKVTETAIAKVKIEPVTRLEPQGRTKSGQ